MTGSKKTYIGLTIGPIVETISNSKETGELWASSYLFSYIMKNIIKKLIVKDRKKHKKIKEYEKLENRFIVPCIQDILEELDNSNSNKKGEEIGLLHDKFIFQSEKGEFELLGEVIDEVIDDIAKDIVKIKEKENKNKSYEEIRNNIDDFLKIYYLEVDVELEESKDQDKGDNNIILKVNKCLEALELREKMISDNGIKENYLTNVLKNKYMNNSKTHFLTKDAYGEGGNQGSYPSLRKIALGQTYDNEFPNEDDDIDEKLEEYEFKNELIKANEYVAVVQADGDSMGKFINNLKIQKGKDDIFEDYKEFSKKLLNYAKESHKKIKEYSGFTIYAGGDDLLFIAPVINKDKTKNIFDLIDCLSESSDKESKDKMDKLTTSFGVAIVHYKFPLYYALDEARDLLFNKAKSYKLNGKEKNAIAFRVIKSSGQSFETIVGKDSKSYKEFKKLFSSVSNSTKSGIGTNKINTYLKSIHFKLKRDKVILNEIGQDKEILKNYFDNNFDEKIHKTGYIKTYIKYLVDFIHEIYKEMGDQKGKDKELCINQIYTFLRFIKFMDEGISKKEKVKK